MIRTSVVIPTYNRCTELARVINRALADSATDELVVVVDGCDDGTFELLEDMRCSDARIVPLFIENQGEDRAREVGIKHAGGEVVVMIDDDVLVEAGTISGHARHHTKRAHSLLLGYMPVRLPRTRKSDDVYLYYYKNSYEQHVAQWEREPTTILEHMWGGHFSMRRSDALAVGLANRDTKLTYHTDFEFGERCRSAGLVGYFDRNLRSEHLFERNLDAFVRDAYIQGVDRVRLDEIKTGHPGDGRRLLRWHTRGQRALVAASRWDRVAKPLSVALQLTVKTSGLCRAYGFQMAAARRLQRINQLRGVRTGLTLSQDIGPRLR